MTAGPESNAQVSNEPNVAVHPAFPVDPESMQAFAAFMAQNPAFMARVSQSASVSKDTDESPVDDANEYPINIGDICDPDAPVIDLSDKPSVADAITETPLVLTVEQRFKAVNERMIELCREGKLAELTLHIEQNPSLIQICTGDFEAWTVAAENAHTEVCKYLKTHFSAELGEQSRMSLFAACRTNNINTIKMLLEPVFNITSDNVLFGLRIAGECGHSEVIDHILKDVMPKSSTKYCYLAAAMFGLFRSGKPELLTPIFPKWEEIGNTPSTNKKMFRSMLFRAAQVGDAETFLKVLGNVNCEFRHKPESASHYYDFSKISNPISNSDALFRIVELCCKNSSSLLIDGLINLLGELMYIDDDHRSCLEDACANGHVNAVKLFTAKHKFADTAGLVKIARDSNQAAVLAMLFDKYGQEVVFEAEPEHNDRIRQLLHSHFEKLASRFVPASKATA